MNEIYKEFEKQFYDMLNLIESHLGISERENVREFLEKYQIRKYDISAWEQYGKDNEYWQYFRDKYYKEGYLSAISGKMKLHNRLAEAFGIDPEREVNDELIKEIIKKFNSEKGGH